MRKVLLTLIGFVVSVTLTQSTFAGSWLTKKVIPGSAAYIRSAPNAFIIGTLIGISESASDHFVYNTDQASGDYRFGYGGGEAGKCGWVNINYFKPPNVNASSPCTSWHYSTAEHTAARDFLFLRYARCINDYVPNLNGSNQPFPSLDLKDGTFQQTVALSDPYPLFGNYNYTTYAMQTPVVGYIYPGQGVFWRWVSFSSGVMMVRLNNGATFPNGTWGFVPRGLLVPNLKYADGNTRPDSLAGNG